MNPKRNNVVAKLPAWIACCKTMGTRGRDCRSLRRALLVAALPMSLFVSYVAPTPARARLDRTFGESGVAQITLPSPPARSSKGIFGTGMAAYKDGETFIQTEGATCDCVAQSALFHFASDGLLDTTFGGGGAYLSDSGRAAGQIDEVGISPVAIDSKGRPLLARSSGGISLISRLTPSGQLDKTFGEDGSVTSDCSCGYEELQLIPGQGGTVTLSLSSKTTPWGGSEYVYVYSLMRLRADGSLDTEFGTDGSTAFYMRAYSPLSWATSTGGALYLGGARYNEERTPYVVRVSAKGRLDRRFDAAARRSLGSLNHSWVEAVLPRPNGTIDVLGPRNSNHGGFDARLKPNGRPDPTFGRNGVKRLPFGVWSASLGEDGTTFAVGWPVSEVRPFRLLGILPDGEFDPAFGRHGEPIPVSAGRSAPSVVALDERKAEVLDPGDVPLCRGDCHPEPTLSRFVDR
jgi:uncharacterized delta-60 repeat protein